MARALMVSLVALGTLAALGGAFPSTTLPILLAASAAFLLSRARVAAADDTRLLDLALLGFAGGIAIQLVPLPGAVSSALSPHAWTLQSFLQIRAAEGFRPLSIDARLTREGLATAASALLLFWAARESFRRGGVRLAARVIAWGGCAAALVGLVQRATAPTLLLWRWTPADPGSQPFGPFVNRNHFAMWLLMASALTAGYLVSHLRSHRFDERPPSARLMLRDLLADGGALLLAGALLAMMLALVSSLSRAALLGLATAAVVAGLLARRRGARDGLVAAAAIALLLAGAIWVNRQGLIGRLDATITAQVGRPVIWAETLPLIRDFWLTGTGGGTYGEAMLRYQRTSTEALFNQAHNEYLQLAAEGGLLLVVPALVAAWRLTRTVRGRLAEDTHELLWLRIGAAAGLCGVAVHCLFESGLRMPANALLFALLAGIAVHEPRRVPQSTEISERE